MLIGQYLFLLFQITVTDSYYALADAVWKLMVKQNHFWPWKLYKCGNKKKACSQLVDSRLSACAEIFTINVKHKEQIKWEKMYGVGRSCVFIARKKAICFRTYKRVHLDTFMVFMKLV